MLIKLAQDELKKEYERKKKNKELFKEIQENLGNLTGYVKNIVNLLPSKSNLKNYIRPITQFINKINKINQKLKNMTLLKGINFKFKIRKQSNKKKFE